jgi:hypothetical protein
MYQGQIGEINEIDEQRQMARVNFNGYHQWINFRDLEPYEDKCNQNVKLYCAFVPVVHRPAEAGEWVYINKPWFTAGCYKKGDILQAKSVDESGTIRDYGVKNGVSISLGEYLVIEGYKPEDKPKMPQYFKGEE